MENESFEPHTNVVRPTVSIPSPTLETQIGGPLVDDKIQYHIELLEEEQRARMKADIKEYEIIAGLLLVGFTFSVGWIRWLIETGSAGVLLQMNFWIFLAFFIALPGFFFTRLPRIWLFSDKHRNTKELNVEEKVQENMQEREQSVKQSKKKKHITALREAKSLRIRGGR